MVQFEITPTAFATFSPGLTPKALANFSPGLERQRQPWDQQYQKHETLKRVRHPPNPFRVPSLPPLNPTPRVVAALQPWAEIS
jgi:hypothetical protein